MNNIPTNQKSGVAEVWQGMAKATTKASFFRLRNNLWTLHGDRKAGQIIRKMVLSGRLPPIIYDWIREKYNKERKRQYHAKLRPNADLPRFNKDRTPRERQIARQRALMKERKRYIKRTWTNPKR